ncbi:glycosyltransferase family 2 protein [Synechocystis salina LEGE 06099]|uniref:glycosyltransferase family 2 protein n=1 Tax=Synechocystis salina TaxID=945780 RepID=UPI0018823C12|nr:glycosyltransferase family 2 protein [Synechocystis salina]MBE9203840.1 glycosyltransferase family 2 protein [Synechocystis salina LEGE 06099]
MDLALITPLILTYNEAPNIERTLQKLQWAKRIVIIDSFSNDETLEIANNHPQVEFFQRQFTSFADQCNFGLGKISTEWVLSLDADYILTQSLIEELNQIPDDTPINGYKVPFKYCVFGQPLRGTLLPPRCVLYRPQFAKYEDDGHAHRVNISGRKGQLNHPIYHDDRKPLSRWLWAQDRYMIIEAQKLTQTPSSQLSWGDKIRKQKILAPFIIFVYCLIIKGGILDGWRGWYYAFQRVFAEILLSLRLMEAELLETSGTNQP